MKRRRPKLVTALLILAACALMAADAQAGLFNRGGGRRGLGLLRRSSGSSSQGNYSRQSKSSRPHMTHSRSAILDGVFGPNPYGNGHDRSWYVGR